MSITSSTGKVVFHVKRRGPRSNKWDVWRCFDLGDGLPLKIDPTTPEGSFDDPSEAYRY